jgi:hypothetical protein
MLRICRFRISAGRSAILREEFCSCPQFLQANVEIAPCLRPRTFPSESFPTHHLLPVLSLTLHSLQLRQRREINHKEKNTLLLISGFMSSSYIYFYLEGIHKYIMQL